MSDLMPIPPNVRHALDGIFGRLTKAHALQRIKLANMVHEQLLSAIGEVAAIRRASVRELVTQGMSYAAIGRELGISTSRVRQIEIGGTAPAKAEVAS